MLSSGARKDLLVMTFAKSMIEVSYGEDARSDENLAPRVDNKDYRANKKIDNALIRLKDKLTESIDKLYTIGGKDTVEWIRKNLHKRIGGTLTKIQAEQINLEMLAIWVLYVNFADVKRQLHEEMKWLSDGAQLLKIADMMEETKISDLQGDMFNIAYDVIERVKG